MTGKRTLFGAVTLFLVLVVAVGAALAVGNNPEDGAAVDSTNDVENVEDHLQDLEARIETASLISALNYINAAGFHDMDEALSEGEINPRYLGTVEGVIAVTEATTWPEDLEPSIAEFRNDLGALEEGLENEDVDAAAEASHGIHSSQHALSEAALAKLVGAEVAHDEDETDSHDDGQEAEDGHDDAEENGDDGHEDEATSGGDAGENAATLGITDWAFESDVQVDAGTATLTVTNDGDMPHGVYIPELGVNESVPSGETKTITIDASEHGEYTILCNDPMCGTAEQHGGMMAKFVVE